MILLFSCKFKCAFRCFGSPTTPRARTIGFLPLCIFPRVLNVTPPILSLSLFLPASQSVSFLQQRSHLCRRGGHYVPCLVGLFLSVCAHKDAFESPPSSCTAAFTSANTVLLCDHLIVEEMTEGLKKEGEKGRNQGDRRDLGEGRGGAGGGTLETLEELIQ